MLIQEIDNRWNIVRLGDSIKILFKKKGYLKGTVSTFSLFSAQFLAGVITYFCAKGSVISLQEMAHEKRYLINLRAYGDVGGWLMICLLAGISAKSIFEGFIGEAEYLKCQSLLKKQMKAGHSLPGEALSQLLKAYASKCFFNKSVASQKLLVNHYTTPSSYEMIAPQLIKIDAKLCNQISPKNYLKRVAKGGQAVFKAKGSAGLLISSIMGIALPAFLVLFGVFSLVGEVGLGKELFIEKTSLDDTGHFGEWLINFFEGVAAAYLLHVSYILNEGDYAIRKEIYNEEIALLQNDEEACSQEQIVHLSGIKKEELNLHGLHYKKFD